MGDPACPPCRSAGPRCCSWTGRKGSRRSRMGARSECRPAEQPVCLLLAWPGRLVVPCAARPATLLVRPCMPTCSSVAFPYPLPPSPSPRHTGCVVCDPLLTELCEVKHGRAFVRRGGRGGRGRGRGRGRCERAAAALVLCFLHCAPGIFCAPQTVRGVPTHKRKHQLPWTLPACWHRAIRPSPNLGSLLPAGDAAEGVAARTLTQRCHLKCSREQGFSSTRFLAGAHAAYSLTRGSLVVS